MEDLNFREIGIKEKLEWIENGKWFKLRNRYARKIKYPQKRWTDQDEQNFDKWVENNWRYCTVCGDLHNMAYGCLNKHCSQNPKHKEK